MSSVIVPTVPSPTVSSLCTTPTRRRVLEGMAGRRRALQVALGLVWLLDAALQFQPFMFSRSFVTQIIQPSADGSPPLVAHSVAWASQVMLDHIAVYNAVFATIQLLIAVGLFFRRTVKVTLAASIVWALFVWWFGESLGGIFTSASPLTGLPGGVVLYALIAVLLWPKNASGGRRRISPAKSGPLGPVLSDILWLILWGSYSYFLLLPANRAPSGISQDFAFTVGQPAWLTSLMNDISRLSNGRGTEISVVLAVLCVLVALGVFAAPTLRPALLVAMGLGVFFLLAQGFGGILTGQGTDPNSGLLLVLLAACYWPAQGPVTGRARRSDPALT
jgi:hypothetical protein